MSDFIRNLFHEQRKRLVGSVMSAAEQTDWYSTLSPEQRSAHRERVLNAINAHHEVVLDVLKAAAAESSVSDDALRLLQAVHDRTARIERRITREPTPDVPAGIPGR